MSDFTAADWVATLLDSAAKLRAAGVEEVSAGAFRAVLRAPDGAVTKVADDESDPLKDPTTFHGRIPMAVADDEPNPFVASDS